MSNPTPKQSQLPVFVFRSLPEVKKKERKQRWKKAVNTGIAVGLGKNTKDPVKLKTEVDKLWESTQMLMQTENMTETDIETLRHLIQEAVDVSGRIRLLIRDKDNYTNEDVLSHARDINCLQLLFHGVVEVWTKVEMADKERHKHSILPDMMELATDVAAVYGEVMSLLLQRFGLDITPLMRPIHGLFYSLSIHCRYHCPDLETESENETKDLYNSFLSALHTLMKSTKVLLKRLLFDQDVARQRRRLVQANISHVISVMHGMVQHGNRNEPGEYTFAIEKIGSLCTDIFFTIGKTTGVSELLELGEGVVAMEPADVLGEVAHSDIERCSIEQRPVFLSGLMLDDGAIFISDLFIQTGSQFNPSKRVTMKMPFAGGQIPLSRSVKVKLKMGNDWFDTPGEIVDDHIHFQCKYMSGFIAMLDGPSTIKEIPVTNFTYTCLDDVKVRVTFPEGCLEKPADVQFKLLPINRARMYEYREHCPNNTKNIVAISDCLKMDHDDDLVFHKPIIIHLPLPDDIDDPETEIVLFRSRDDFELELIPKRSAMVCPSTQNCYTFQVQSLGGIAIGKVRKKSLKKNRSAVVEEYDIYTERSYICNILTLLDKSLLHVGMLKLWVEVVEKMYVKKALKMRGKEGLFELPGSRSPNLSFRNEDIVCVEADGNIQRMKEIPLQNYFIVFLSSGKDNFRSFPVEQRKDPEGRAFGILNFYKDNEEEQKLLHTSTVDGNRYLIGASGKNTGSLFPSRGPSLNPTGLNTPKSFGASWTSTHKKSIRESTAYRLTFDNVPVLNHNSLLSLASNITMEMLQNVSYELGIPYQDIINLKNRSTPQVIMNFELLWKWRGKMPNKDMTYFLIRAFRICGYGNTAAKIIRAEKEKRPMTKDDFRYILPWQHVCAFLEYITQRMLILGQRLAREMQTPRKNKIKSSAECRY